MKPLGRCWAAVSDVFTGVPADPHSCPAAAPALAEAGDTSRMRTHLLRHRGRLVAACLATVLGPAVVAQAGALGPQGVPEARAAEQPAADEVPAPVAGDPATWMPAARRAAATCPGLSPSVLVAIVNVESTLGLHPGTSAAGAVGPMQFLPSTWAAYAADGDGDGVSDAMDPIDAMYGATRLLCANGGADPDVLPSALWNYNHSDDYVRQVLTLARFTDVGS